MRIILTALFLVMSYAGYSQYPADFTIEKIWKDYAYSTAWAPTLRWTPDSKYIVELNYDSDGAVINAIDPATYTKAKTLVSDKQLGWGNDSDFLISDFAFGISADQILLTSNEESIYRYSSRADYHIYNIVDSSLHRVCKTGKCMYPAIAPGGDKVAYVKGNNIFINDFDSVTQVTADGKKGHIINGASDWVYEEEFELTRAYEWSPDGRYLAYLKFDESHVKEYGMTLYDSLYPYPYTFKYPKAGEKNAIVRLLCFDTKADTTYETDVSMYEYVPRLHWIPETTTLAYQTFNRNQNEWKLESWDVSNGRKSLLMAESSDKFISLHTELRFRDKENVLWISDQDGSRQLYQFNLTTQKNQWLSQRSKFGVKKLIMYTTDKVIYQSFNETTTIDVREHSVQNMLDGWYPQTRGGVASNVYSPDMDYSTVYFSDINTPTEIRFIPEKASKSNDRTLVDNSAYLEANPFFFSNRKEFIKIPTSRNDTLNAWILKPYNFKKNKPYPLIITQYSGPGSQRVLDQWGGTGHIMHHYMASQNYIVVCIDPRGTGGRGTEWKKCTYKQLGVLEGEDLIDAAKWLGQKKYIDAENIGIYGWSYGGTMAARCALVGGKTFKAAFAVAPVTDWKFYDTIYTERYMQTPQQNPEGYAASSLLNKAHMLETNLMLVHGTGDDNVHIQNTYALAEALTANNKPFEMKIYPDKNHGIYGGYTRTHLFEAMMEYFDRHLKND